MFSIKSRKYLLLILCAAFLVYCILLLFPSSGSSENFLFLKEKEWKSVSVYYHVCEGGVSTPTFQTIDDKNILNALRMNLNLNTWSYAPLHIADKWNKVIVKYEDGNNVKFVCGANGVLCYYAHSNNSIFFEDNSAFYDRLLITVSHIKKNNQVSLLSNSPCPTDTLPQENTASNTQTDEN